MKFLELSEKPVQTPAKLTPLTAANNTERQASENYIAISVGSGVVIGSSNSCIALGQITVVDVGSSACQNYENCLTLSV